MKCKKHTESKDPSVLKTKNGRIMLSSNCAVCGSKKSRFVKEQEASRIISSLAKSLISIPFVCPILF